MKQVAISLYPLRHDMRRTLYRLLPRPVKSLLKKLWQTAIECCRLLGARATRFGGPVGSYEIPEQDLSLILPAQFCPPAPPDSLRVKAKLGQDKFQPWPIFYARLPEARLVGECLAVMNADKKILGDCAFRGAGAVRSDPSYNYFYLPPPTELAGAWTSLISRWTLYPNYYEWLISGLSRLACLNNFPEDTRVLIPHRLAAFQRESLQLLGIYDRCRVTTETHLLVEDYYHASQTAMVGCHNPYAVDFLRRSFLPKAIPVPPDKKPDKKIYVSRKRSGRRAPLNEAELETFLSANGWDIVCAEDYSFVDQIRLFNAAAAVCMQHGAGLANMLWCDPPGKILELCPHNFLNGSGEALAAAMGHDYRYLIFPADADWRVTVDINSVRRTLSEMNCL